jgi:putative heme iron utilization protein
LAVLVDGRPFASLVPFALSEDGGSVLIHASALARHSAGLQADAPFSLLIHQPDDSPSVNPAQLGRLSLQGAVQPLQREGPGYDDAKSTYLQKFPKSQITFGLGDFTLYALEIQSGRLVAGFARTHDLTPDQLAGIAASRNREPDENDG